MNELPVGLEPFLMAAVSSQAQEPVPAASCSPHSLEQQVLLADFDGLQGGTEGTAGGTQPGNTEEGRKPARGREMENPPWGMGQGGRD